MLWNVEHFENLRAGLLCKKMANVTRSDNAILGVILALFGKRFGDHIWK